MNPKVLLLLGVASLLPVPARAESPVAFDLKDDGLRVRIGGQPFATYVWRDRTVRRPYFAHVHAPDGRPVTRTHPPVEGTDATDHAAMHPGLWLAFGDVSGADFWRNKGTVEHVEFVERPQTTREGGGFAVRNRYTAGGKTICEEVCRIAVGVRPGGHLIDWTSEFTGPEDFTFGDQEEMGLGVRVATPLTVKNGGSILNSGGSKNEGQVWGKQADWCDYGGEIDGRPVGVALMPHPDNFRRSWFHARDYGVLVANPFGRNAFTKGQKCTVVVRKGESFLLRFGVLVHSGRVDVAAAYKDWLAAGKPTDAGGMPWVAVSGDKSGFVLEPSGETFIPWGFNYDHDEQGRLIEDYWGDEWATVEADFAEMKALGANVVRVHLQLGKFMDGPDRPNRASLDRLSKLLRLAESTGLYLNLTGLGCYHKKDVQPWYDELSEADRWDVQARFWAAVAGRCKDSPAVFCYDLMNEPVVPGGKRTDGDWLGPAFGGKHFVQFVTLDQKGRPRPEIARQWVKHLTAAVRKVDRRHLVTVGLVHWSLDRKGLTSGFVPATVAGYLDFVSVHLYPEAGKLDEALDTLKGFSIGKPVVVEETFPLKCSPAELGEFIDRAGPHAAGWVSFYWGTPPEELRRSKKLGDAILLDWLEVFRRKGRPPAK
ncbi:MAG TPA: DUF6807 family protein [Gemmataceae bacterium]|nr:DUF6807 family protein [Gemmataceae bacterium]